MRWVVIVPTYNERDNLPVLTDRLLALDPPIDVLIVDDASPDGTGELAEEIATTSPRFRVIHRTGQRGYARASLEGFRAAVDADNDIVCTMDADLSHDPDVLPRLLERARDGSDVVIGSRYTPGGALRVEWGPLRRAVSRWGSGYARTMLGIATRDCTSGFRCYRREAAQVVASSTIGSEGYSFLVEILGILSDKGFSVSEVPITYVDRRAGSSKISRMIILEALARTTLLGLRRLAGRTQR
ncbi:MAG: polyprenol monophosphomannose synthase [Actinomycetota bacterium]|nr:polyprenol monophosphomannose synthase [Actinomycetota bacterium]